MIPQFPNVNFIGNKEKIAAWITSFFPPDAKSIFDAFAGGNSISYQSKLAGLQVFSNDILRINYMISKALIENKSERLSMKDIDIIFTGEPVKGFMYENYANVFFFPEECMQLDLYRENIEKLSSDYKKAIAFSLLRRSMIRKMPYSRFNLNWEQITQLRDEQYSYEKYQRKRAYHNKSFKKHFLENFLEYNCAIFDNEKENKAFNEDVFEVLEKVEADIVYLDPPYTGTMNNYFGFYGLIDEYILSKKKQPFDHNFMDKKTAIQLFDTLFSKLKNYKYWFLSYNNSSFPTKEQLITLFQKYATNIQVIEKEHVYKVTGKENKKENTEYLFIVENPIFSSNTQKIYTANENL